MLNNYKLDLKDKRILNELDNLCGVSQNKDILKDIILYIKLRRDNILDFGNCNIIIRNNSTYNLIDDLLRVCAKIFIKYDIIKNKKICYLDKEEDNKRIFKFEKIADIDDSIIVINDRKLRINYEDEIENIKRIIKKCKDKIFIFEDTNFCEGEIDGEVGEIASFRMTIDRISLDDKIVYCKKRLDDYKIKYTNKDLKEYANVPFWTLKNMLIKLIIECKSNDITSLNKQILKNNKEFYLKNNSTRKSKEDTNKNTKLIIENDLNNLVGLNEIKEQIEKITNYILLNKERGQMPSLHMCFTGNPGTGKTTVARIIGKKFEEENILNGNGNFVEIHGRDLVDKFVGWTSQKVQNIVDTAIGGVLFIDEAYSLVADRRGSFEDEAISTLIKEMEDHRDEICIILAGYTEEMRNLINLNPGFESRIQFTINFPDYTETELLKIFETLCKQEKYNLSKKCKEILINNFRLAKNEKNFGNGRYVRNLFEKIKFEQADRIIKTNSKSVNSITYIDVENAIKTINIKKKDVRKIGF